MIDTDTNQASELYELCSEVYEKTGWDNTDSQYDGVGVINSKLKYLSAVPLYTSDYLLQKLPVQLDYEDFHGNIYMEYKVPDSVYKFGYIDGSEYRNSVWSDTPLKALLKLTIALSEAGELNNFIAVGNNEPTPDNLPDEIKKIINDGKKKAGFNPDGTPMTNQASEDDRLKQYEPKDNAEEAPQE